LTVVRAESPGFVRAVCVRDGDQLTRGQVIARLANEELQYTAADIQLALEQSAIKGRVFFHDGELAWPS
jgi:multidrug efflux pump subunit AcrA (membrane-fusion protein)